MDIALALEKIVPAAQYRGSLTDNTEESYNALIWEDSRQKPTWEELQTKELEVLIDSIRLERDKLLGNTDKCMISDFTIEDEPITPEQLIEIKAYRQALKILPKTITLENPSFPEKPDFI